MRRVYILLKTTTSPALLGHTKQILDEKKYDAFTQCIHLNMMHLNIQYDKSLM
jgi:hypothetical protein